MTDCTRILIVDDDATILAALQRLLRALSRPPDALVSVSAVRTYRCACRALERRYEVVICDHDLGDVNGNGDDVLAYAAAASPDALRVLHSGSVATSVHAHLVIRKPAGLDALLLDMLEHRGERSTTATTGVEHEVIVAAEGVTES